MTDNLKFPFTFEDLSAEDNKLAEDILDRGNNQDNYNSCRNYGESLTNSLFAEFSICIGSIHLLKSSNFKFQSFSDKMMTTQILGQM